MPATINRRLSSLRSFYEYLASEQVETHWPSPVIPRRHTLKKGVHLPRDLHDNEAERLLAVIIDSRDKAIFSLMIKVDLRVREVVTLHLESIEPLLLPDHLTKLRVIGIYTQ